MCLVTYKPDQIAPVLDYLGRATAKVHCVSDADSDHTLVPFQTEDAIAAVIGDPDGEFVDWLTTFAREYAAVVRDATYHARTGVLVVENTHNMGGGTVYERPHLER